MPKTGKPGYVKFIDDMTELGFVWLEDDRKLDPAVWSWWKHLKSGQWLPYYRHVDNSLDPYKEVLSLARRLIRSL